MADMTFTTRHSGASVTCTGGLTMVHLFSHIPSEVEIVDSERGPISVKVTKLADPSNLYTSSGTVIQLDWPTACQVAEAVSHRLEEPEHEGQCVPMKLVR
jgi:hypothetical protein